MGVWRSNYSFDLKNEEREKQGRRRRRWRDMGVLTFLFGEEGIQYFFFCLLFLFWTCGVLGIIHTRKNLEKICFKNFKKWYLIIIISDVHRESLEKRLSMFVQ